MQSITVEIGVNDDKGNVRLNMVGRQLIRAMLMKWIYDCDRGREAAREMRLASSGKFSTGQEDYFKAAASKLGQIMTCQVNEVMKLGPQLALIAGWGDDVDLPFEWMHNIIEANDPEEDNGTRGTPVGGSGDVHQQPSRKPAGKGRRRKGKAHASRGG